MRWGCTTARADAYAITIDSFPDDPVRHSPDYFDEANSLLKFISLNVTSCLIPGHGCSVVEYPHRIERTDHLQSQPPPLQYIIRIIEISA